MATTIAFRSAAWMIAFVSLWIVLDYGRPILMPFVMAIFTTILIFPILSWLMKHKVPGGLAILAAQLMGFMPIVLFIFVFLLTVGPVNRALPLYQRHLMKLSYQGTDYFIDWLERFDIQDTDGKGSRRAPQATQPTIAPADNSRPGGLAPGGNDRSGTDPMHRDPDVPIGIGPNGEPIIDDAIAGGDLPDIEPALDPATDPTIIDSKTNEVAGSSGAGATPAVDNREAFRQELKGRVLPSLVAEAMSFAQSLLGTTTAILANLFLVVLMTTFMLIEGHRFGEKFIEAYGVENPILVSLGAITKEVRTYVIAKTVISAFTGLLVWIFLSIVDIESAGFWGLAAFALNYIPNIGSIAASIPPVLIAMVNTYVLGIGEWYEPWVVLGGLFLIQTVIGSFMDPKMVGASLKLSPFVIIMSMLTWGLLWGPFGMILSVPIMVSAKIICSHVEGLEPISTLLKA